MAVRRFRFLGKISDLRCLELQPTREFIACNSGRKLNFNYTTINVPANTTGSVRAETRISTIKLNGVNAVGFTYNTAAQLTSVL